MHEDRYINESSLKSKKINPVGFVVKPRAITEEKIAEGAISTSKIKDKAITLSKIAPEVIGLADKLNAIMEELNAVLSNAVQTSEKINNFFNSFDIEASEEGAIIVTYEDFSEKEA